MRSLRRLLAVALLALGLGVVSAQPVRACSCGEPNRAAAEVVFDGAVVDVSPNVTTTVVVDSAGNAVTINHFGGGTYTFDVSRVLRGEVGDRYDVVIDDTGCATSFLLGSSYRVYLNEFRGRLSTGQCSGNQLLRLNASEGGPGWPFVLLGFVVLLAGRVIGRRRTG